MWEPPKRDGTQNQELSTASGDLENTQKELSAAKEYFEKLKPDCIDIGPSYAERKAQREQEMQESGVLISFHGRAIAESAVSPCRVKDQDLREALEMPPTGVDVDAFRRKEERTETSVTVSVVRHVRPHVGVVRSRRMTNPWGLDGPSFLQAERLVVLDMAIRIHAISIPRSMSLDLRTDGAKRGEFRAEVAVESCANAGWKDQRFEGQIVKYLVDKGYGFIRCQELRQSRYPDRDIFLHQKQLGNFKEGDAVSFGIFLNRDGKPQATELAYLNGGGEQQYQQQGQYPQQSQQYQQQSQHQQYPQEYQQQQYQQYSQQQYQQGQYQQYSQEYQSQDHYGMQGQGGDQASMGEWPPQPPQEEEGTHEVEVPKDLVSQLEGGSEPSDWMSCLFCMEGAAEVDSRCCRFCRV
ncbi:unnamed protein product [Durusdinium trenchii]|uniref:CSD domain-containing protein n=1 Tax=Durusdinium trenchii TaxID=1381693 RepID=A0ABP0NXZ5_9DINO